ncbi:MAG: hypothetical protein IKI97_03855 [Clostridia bacterium]|nr:hypothetical protein [Clostridia bacterium]
MLLYILLFVLALVFLLCLLNVKITVGNRDKFYYCFSVGGIKINPQWFAGKKDGHKKKKDGKKKKKSDKKPSKKQSQTKAGEGKKETKKKSAGEILSLVLEVAKTARDVLPRGVRIRLKYLNITVGDGDAAKVAINYGRYYAILSGLFALFDGYRGIFYGFRAKRNKVVLKTDYFSGKTTAEFELTISFFIWQLLYSGIRIGITLISNLIKDATNDNIDGETALVETEKALKEKEKTEN